MSKAMRVCDREVIERQVVNAWKKKSEKVIIEKLLETKFGEALDNDLADYNNLVKEITALEKKRDELRRKVSDDIRVFNESNCEVDDNSYRHNYYGTYVDTDIGSYGNSRAKGYTLNTNIPHELRSNISDELALSTMGGDFNGNDLVVRLIEMFVE